VSQDHAGERDLSMPTMADADHTHPGYSRWKHALPLPNERMMLHIGAQTVENFFVVADAWAQVLSHYIQPDSHIMDVGCGCGRTARILVNNPNIAKYTGFDVVEPYIAWCNRYFGEIHGDRFRFHHLDVRTERYNPNGLLTGKTARFPAPDASVDLLFAASLFTHLMPEDVIAYGSEMKRVIKPGGQAIVSIHDQPDAESQFSGNEHRADYNPEYFVKLLGEFDLELKEDIGDLCGQRTLVMKKRA
jgi:SAM-dependent methyltransferase